MSDLRKLIDAADKAQRGLPIADLPPGYSGQMTSTATVSYATTALERALRNAAPMLDALIDAAKRAEYKLRLEYRKGVNDGYVPESESWAEGEALAEAVAAVERALRGTGT